MWRSHPGLTVARGKLYLVEKKIGLYSGKIGCNMSDQVHYLTSISYHLNPYYSYLGISNLKNKAVVKPINEYTRLDPSFHI